MYIVVAILQTNKRSNATKWQSKLAVSPRPTDCLEAADIGCSCAYSAKLYEPLTTLGGIGGCPPLVCNYKFAEKNVQTARIEQTIPERRTFQLIDFVDREDACLERT